MFNSCLGYFYKNIMITKSSALTVNLSMAMWKEAGISEAKEEVGSVDRWLEGMWVMIWKGRASKI